MEVLSLLVEGLKYALPAGLVLLTVWLLNKNNQKNLQIQQLAMVKAEMLKQQLPVRLNAYERAILYLDRIKPEHLILRVPVGGLSAGELHYEMVSNVRSEYEHNMAQQVYISPEAWQSLLNAREEVLTLLNTVRSEVEADSVGSDYARLILERASQLPPPSIQSAMNMVKTEVATLLQM